MLYVSGHWSVSNRYTTASNIVVIIAEVGVSWGPIYKRFKLNCLKTKDRFWSSIAKNIEPNHNPNPILFFNGGP